jgi:hypothetical protein
MSWVRLRDWVIPERGDGVHLSNGYAERGWRVFRGQSPRKDATFDRARCRSADSAVTHALK